MGKVKLFKTEITRYSVTIYAYACNQSAMILLMSSADSVYHWF